MSGYSPGSPAQSKRVHGGRRKPIAAKEIPHTKIQTWFPRCRLTAGGVPSRSPILSARDAVARRSSRRSGGNRENATTDAIFVAFLCVRVSRRVCGVCWRVLDRPRSAKCLVVSFRRPPAVWAIYNLPKKNLRRLDFAQSEQAEHVLGGELEMDLGSCVLGLWNLRSQVPYRDRIT